MKWKCKNRVHEMTLTPDDIKHLIEGGIFTVKTQSQNLIVIKRE